MRVRVNRSGFSVVELLIVLVVVGILGLVGYGVYNRQHTKTADTAHTSQSTTQNNTQTAPQIGSTSDLDKAAAVLDQTDTGSNDDSTALDSQLQAF